MCVDVMVVVCFLDGGQKVHPQDGVDLLACCFGCLFMAVCGFWQVMARQTSNKETNKPTQNKQHQTKNNNHILLMALSAPKQHLGGSFVEGY